MQEIHKQSDLLGSRLTNRSMWASLKGLGSRASATMDVASGLQLAGAKRQGSI